MLTVRGLEGDGDNNKVQEVKELGGLEGDDHEVQEVKEPV